MIAGYNCKPVFQYQFRPLMNDRRAPDGGFCIILYENGVLSFSTYDVTGAFMDELCFSCPSRVLHCFYSLLHNAGSWLPACPVDLRSAGITPYASSFAFDGYDPVRIWGINDLLVEPAGSEGGFFSRHLYVLFEDVANLFAEIGIRLTLDGFQWDPQRIQPFRKNPTYSTGQQSAI